MKLTAPQVAALQLYATPAAERPDRDPVRPNTYRVLRREGLVIPNAGGPVLTPAGRDALTRATLPVEELAVVEARAAQLDAMPTDDEEPVIVRAGEAAPLAQHDAPRQDLDGEFRQTEHGLRYLTADEVAAERVVEPSTAGPLTHEHEEWQLDESAQGGRYCRACGATVPTHHTREQVLDRLRSTGGFDLQLGPDDTAYDLETGDTLLGGVTLRYAYGEFPGPWATVTILDDEPAVDDDPREQPAPLDWSSIAAEVAEARS